MGSIDKEGERMEEKSKKVSLRVATGTGLIAVLIYIIVLSIFKEKITAELTLSYFGAMLTAIVTIFGVMWQIQKNNEKIDEEKENSQTNIRNYLIYFLKKNIKEYGTEFNSLDFELLSKEILARKIHSFLKYNNFLYSPEASFLSQNSSIIMSLKNGEKLFDLFNDINDINFKIEKEATQVNLVNMLTNLKKIKNFDSEKAKNWISFLSTEVSSLSSLSMNDVDIAYQKKKENLVSLNKLVPLSPSRIDYIEIIGKFQNSRENPILEIYLKNLDFLNKFQMTKETFVYEEETLKSLEEILFPVAMERDFIYSIDKQLKEIKVKFDEIVELIKIDKQQES